MSEEDLIKELTSSSNCEVCGRLYDERDVNVIGHDEDIWVIQVSCSACHAQALLAALVDEDDESAWKETTDSVESAPDQSLSDLTEIETGKFKHVIITSDDVLDMHNYLSGFRGSYPELFE